MMTLPGSIGPDYNPDAGMMSAIEELIQWSQPIVKVLQYNYDAWQAAHPDFALKPYPSPRWLHVFTTMLTAEKSLQAAKYYLQEELDAQVVIQQAMR